jgi:hypothetical protein
MVYRIVLIDFPRLGWLVAFRYLGLRCACGWPATIAFSAAGGAGGRKSLSRDFPYLLLPGLIASITLFMLWWLGERDHLIGTWKWVLPPLMIFFQS